LVNLLGDLLTMAIHGRFCGEWTAEDGGGEMVEHASRGSAWCSKPWM